MRDAALLLKGNDALLQAWTQHWGLLGRDVMWWWQEEAGLSKAKNRHWWMPDSQICDLPLGDAYGMGPQIP